MNTDKKVFEKLFSKEKLELGSQKYEFALTDDVKKVINDYYNIANTGYKKTGDSLSALKDALSIHNKALSEANKFDSLLTKINQMAKEIGIDPNNIQPLSELKKAISEKKRTSENISAIEKAISLLS
jgi:seryl-tRNA synthetase